MDVGDQFARFNERKQKLEQGVESVVNAVGDRLVESNRRNNAHECMLGKITATLMSLNKKMGQNIKDTHQIQDGRTQMGKKIGRGK